MGWGRNRSGSMRNALVALFHFRCARYGMLTYFTHTHTHTLSLSHTQKVAVLVSDMAGFTRLTRKYGILHFASLILFMRSVVRPILLDYGVWVE